MTKLILEIPKDQRAQIRISIIQAIRELDIHSTRATTETNQTADATPNDVPFCSKDQLDFQIAMIASLAG